MGNPQPSSEGVCRYGQVLPVRQLLQEWVRRHGPFFSYHDGCLLALSMPISHALLLSHGGWASYSLPVLAKRERRRSGYHLLKFLWHGVPEPLDPEPADSDEVEAITPGRLQELADAMRQWVPHVQHLGLDALRSHVSWVQKLSDSMSNIELQQSKKVYDVETLVQAVVFAGMLQSSAKRTVTKALKLAASLTLPANLVGHFHASIDRKYTVPTKSTLQQHRLTLTLAYFAYLAHLYEQLLGHRGSVFRFETFDSSPQGGYNYFIRGVITIRVDDLWQAFKICCQLCLPVDERDPDFDEADALDWLAQFLHRHPGMLTVLGSGRSGLVYKFKCWCHSLRMESTSWQMVVDLASSVVSFTTDFGTESHFADLPAVRLYNVFPWAARDVGGGFAFVGMGQAHAAGLAAAPATLVVRLTGALPVPGLLHILHNIAKDLSGSLDNFASWASQLKAVCKICSRRYYKGRLLNTCFSAGRASAFYPQVKRFYCIPYTERWGSVAHATLVLLAELRDALGVGWNREAFNFGRRAGGAPPPDGGEANDDDGPLDDRGQAVVVAADAAITSPFFWAYAEMLDTLFEIILLLFQWCECCTCHEEEYKLLGRSRHARSAAMHRRYGVESCPCRGMRAADLAADQFFPLLNNLLNKANSTIYIKCLGLQDPADRASILNDFAKGRQLIETTLRLKLSCWRQLPYVLCALAHFDSEIAREAACRVRGLFERSQALGAEHHPLTVLICGVLAVELQRMAEGTHLEHLVRLRIHVAKLRFILIVERWVEGIHAQVHKRIAAKPRQGPAFAAWTMAQSFITDLVTCPDSIDGFARWCRGVRNPWLAVRYFGFKEHPEAVETVARFGMRGIHLKGFTWDSTSLVGARLYLHADQSLTTSPKVG